MGTLPSTYLQKSVRIAGIGLLFLIKQGIAPEWVIHHSSCQFGESSRRTWRHLLRIKPRIKLLVK